MLFLANNFNSPILTPFRKHASAASTSHPSTPSNPNATPKKSTKKDDRAMVARDANEKTFSTVISLDQLIEEMDKF